MPLLHKAETVRNDRQPWDGFPALTMASRNERKVERVNGMLIKTVENNESGKKWEIYKKAENQYFTKYYEFFQSCGWRFVAQDGGKNQGFYYSKESIEYDFDIKVA